MTDETDKGYTIGMKQCLICKKEIIKNPKSHSSKDRKYCSYQCYWKTLLGKSAPNKGKPAPWARNLPQQFRKGHLAPNTAFQKGQKAWNEGKEMLNIRGENHWNWKGGVSEKIRKYNRAKSKEWGKQIFKR